MPSFDDVDFARSPDSRTAETPPLPGTRPGARAGAGARAAIAIDGPVAAGKTSVGRAVAARLGCLFLDTGALYRALTLAALRAGIAPDDGPALAALAARTEIDIRGEGARGAGRAGEAGDPPSAPGPGYTVRLDGQDVTAALRSRDVDASVPAVSAHAGVRDALIHTQRRIVEQGPAVLVGRDIGTVVLPDAGLKIFLVASAEERARRRYRERLALGEPATWGEVLAATTARDARDAGRDVAPLEQADDAIVVDTDGLSFEEVVERIVELAIEPGAGRTLSTDRADSTRRAPDSSLAPTSSASPESSPAPNDVRGTAGERMP